MSVVSVSFLVAGLVAAGGPLAIHFLLRRRRPNVPWGAMELLRRAVEQTRLRQRWRTVLLLVTRTLAILGLGLLFARPYLASDPAEPRVGSYAPRHVLLILDHSLSMSYTELGKSRLDQARQAAAAAIRDLPSESRVSLFSTCGAGWDLPLTTPELAAAALARLEPVEWPCRLPPTVARVRRAIDATPTLPAEVYLYTDGQASDWDAAARQVWMALTADRNLAATLHQFGNGSATANVWLAGVRTFDALSDDLDDTRFVVDVGRGGIPQRQPLEVVLRVDGQEADRVLIELQPGDGRQQVQLRHRYRLPLLPAGDRPATTIGSAELTALRWSVVEVSIGADQLEADNRWLATFPVVHRPPIVFVDDADLASGVTAATPTPTATVIATAAGTAAAGETAALRKLLAADEPARVRRLSPQAASLAAFDNVAAVIIAGLSRPSAQLVTNLRQFVERGGCLLVAAGGDFDPAAWQAEAWRNGAGILAAPLAAELVGVRLRDADDHTVPYGIKPVPYGIKPGPDGIKPDWPSRESWVRLPNLDDDQAARLLAEPLFFRFASPVIDGWPAAPADRDSTPRSAPVVHAQLNDDPRTPLWLARDVGRGRLWFFGSSISGDWSTLSSTNAILLLDHWARREMASRLPSRTFVAGPQAVVTLSSLDGSDALQLEQTLTADAAADRTAPGFRPALVRREADSVDGQLNLTRLAQRGVWWLSPAAAQPARRFPVAIVGRAEESDMKAVKLDTLLRPPGQIAAASRQPIESRSWSRVLLCLVLVLAGIESLLTCWRGGRRADDKRPARGA